MNRNFIFQLESLTLDAKLDMIDIDMKKLRVLLEKEVPFKIKNYEIFQKNFSNKHLTEDKFFSENILKFIFGSELQHQREDNKDTTCSMNSLDVFNSKGRNIEKEENISDYKDESSIFLPKLSISASLDNKFSGNVLEHNQIEMTIDEYISYRGEINLYLSQINLINLDHLNNMLRFQNLEKIVNKEFSRINIWHSYKPTLSKFHYDGYENFLFLIKGKKIFTTAPNNSILIKPSKIGENSGNQYERVNFKRMTPKLSKIKEELNNEVKFFFQKDSGNNLTERVYIDLIKKITKYFLVEIELNENEIIYIPEGWWHQVETIGDDNLAFNFWWEKSNILIDNNKEIFVIKQSLNKLVEKKIKAVYIKNIRRKEYKKFRLRNLKRYISQKKHNYLIKTLFPGNNPSLSVTNDYFIGICLIYTQFEKQKNSPDNKTFFQKFWEIIEEKGLSEKFFKNINDMKRKIALDILNNQIKDCI